MSSKFEAVDHTALYSRLCPTQLEKKRKELNGGGKAGAEAVRKRNQAKTASPNFSKKSEKVITRNSCKPVVKKVTCIVILITTYG